MSHQGVLIFISDLWHSSILQGSEPDSLIDDQNLIEKGT